jgi:hypothetical protein
MLISVVTRAVLSSIAALSILGLATPTSAEVRQGEMAPQKIALGNGGGGPSGIQVVEDFHIIHLNGFKSAPKRIGITVFNVAFRNEKFQSATTHRTTSWTNVGALGINLVNTAHETKSESGRTQIAGIDPATRQRITDTAYSDFVDQLTKAGYEVVGPAELAKLAPEYATWAALPNFSPGRFGTYVAPTGRSLFFLRNDASKGDSQGDMTANAQAFQGFDSPLAFKRSPYIAHDGNLGILAVTLVVDYATFTNTGDTKKFNAEMKVGYTPGVTAQAGSFISPATMLDYWGTNSGGFPAVAVLAAPLSSNQAFAITDNSAHDQGQVVLNADPARFESAAREVTHAANGRLVATFAAAAAK